MQAHLNFISIKEMCLLCNMRVRQEDLVPDPTDTVNTILKNLDTDKELVPAALTASTTLVQCHKTRLRRSVDK